MVKSLALSLSTTYHDSIYKLRATTWAFLFIILVIGISSTRSQAQSPDSILRFDAYIEIVKQHHPFIYKTDIMLGIGDAKILKARGAFDPKIASGLSHKQFEDKNYYTMFQGGLSVPLWFGSDIKVNFDRNNGIFLNNSDIIPSQGLLGPGIDLALGRGLFSDDRRATLQKAKLLRLRNDLQRDIILNDLVYQASNSYLSWQESMMIRDLMLESVALADTRLDITKESYNNGYSAAVDTLEVKIELQNRQQSLVQFQELSTNNLVKLSNYLWVEGRIPLNVDSNLATDSIDITRFIRIVDSLKIQEPELLASHPIIESYNNKMDVYRIDEKLNKENLKPDLNLSYNPLIDFDNQVDNGSLFMDNYKLGAFFSYPIFTRKERAELQITRFKMDEVGFDLALSRQKIQLQLQQYSNSIRFLNTQLEQITEIRINSKALLDAENEKFRIGESSVFLVNSREQKYIEARQKEISIKIKIMKNATDYLYTLNKLWEL